jgi:hypothetical protein
VDVLGGESYAFVLVAGALVVFLRSVEVSHSLKHTTRYVQYDMLYDTVHGRKATTKKKHTEHTTATLHTPERGEDDQGRRD